MTQDQDPRSSPENPAATTEDRSLDRRDFLAKSLPVPLALITIVQGGQSTGCQAGQEKLSPSAAAEGEPGEQPVEEGQAAESPGPEGSETAEAGYEASEHSYAMGIAPDLCIGCGRCVEACKVENDVPREPFYFRTWVERYVLQNDGETVVSSPDGGVAGFPPVEEADILRTFFVPKLCNQCANPPCVQVCPVGATFTTEDGVVLVDEDYCIGCRYCIQACPYGARFLDPVTRTAEKCTFCYHRLVKGLTPACVEVCPTQARIFGEINVRSSPLTRFTRMNKTQVLKSHLNTEPRVYYANLDGEVT